MLSKLSKLVPLLFCFVSLLCVSWGHYLFVLAIIQTTVSHSMRTLFHASVNEVLSHVVQTVHVGAITFLFCFIIMCQLGPLLVCSGNNTNNCISLNEDIISCQCK